MMTTRLFGPIAASINDFTFHPSFSLSFRAGGLCVSFFPLGSFSSKNLIFFPFFRHCFAAIVFCSLNGGPASIKWALGFEREAYAETHIAGSVRVNLNARSLC